MRNLERRSKVCATLRVLICIKRRRLGQLSAKIILGRGVHARSLCLFLSFYIFLTSIARMSKFILLTNWDSLLGHTREADEMFKKNSERQNKWMSRSWFANYPKTGIDRLKQFRIFRNILKSQAVCALRLRWIVVASFSIWRRKQQKSADFDGTFRKS